MRIKKIVYVIATTFIATLSQMASDSQVDFWKQHFESLPAAELHLTVAQFCAASSLGFFSLAGACAAHDSLSSDQNQMSNNSANTAFTFMGIASLYVGRLSHKRHADLFPKRIKVDKFPKKPVPGQRCWICLDYFVPEEEQEDREIIPQGKWTQTVCCQRYMCKDCTNRSLDDTCLFCKKKVSFALLSDD